MPVVEKTYTVWIDTTPQDGARTWVQIEFIRATGTLDENRMPFAQLDLTVHIPPESVAAQFFDPRQPTRVRVEAAASSPAVLPWCYVVARRRIAGQVWELSIESEDGHLLTKGNTTSETVSWREHLTMNALVPVVCAAAGVTVSTVMPVAGRRCDPVYEKRNYIRNPQPVDPAVVTEAEPWSGSLLNYVTAGVVVTATIPRGHQFSPHPDDGSYPVTEGQQYVWSFVASGPPTMHLKTLNLQALFRNRFGRTVGPIVSTVFTFGTSVGRAVLVFTVPRGAVEVRLWGYRTGVAPGDEFLVSDAMLTEYDLGDRPDLEYWDGDTGATLNYEHAWLQADGHGESVRLPVIPRALEAVLQEPGATYWSVIAPHLAREGWRLAPAAPGEWVVRPTDYVDVTAPYDLTDGKYVELDEGISAAESGYADAILLHYSWRSGRQGELEAWDRAGPPTPVRPVRVDLHHPYPGPGAAEKYLAKAGGKAWQRQVTVPCDLAYQPSRTTGGGVELVGAITKLSFDTEADTMTLTLRNIL